MIRIASPSLPLRHLGWLTLLCVPQITFAQNPQVEVWVHQSGSSAGEVVTEVVANSDGGATLVGHTQGDLAGPSLGSTDGFFMRFDADGQVLWQRILGTSEADRLVDIQPDQTGGYLMAGSTQGALGTTHFGQVDGIVARVDAQGTVLWTTQLGTAGDDSISALALDGGAGGAWFGGSTDGDLAASNAGSSDAFVGRINSSGNVIWMIQSGTTSDETLTDLAPDGSGGVYAIGTTGGAYAGANAGGLDVLLVHYSAAGAVLWSRQFGSSGNETASSILVKGPNEIYLGGSTTGTLFGGPASFHGGGWVAAYDGTGQALWGTRITRNNYQQVTALAPAPQDGVLAFTNETLDLSIIPTAYLNVSTHFSSTGVEGPFQQFGPQTFGGILGFAASDEGHLYIAGHAQETWGAPTQGGTDIILARLETQIGTSFCGPANGNSTGLPARILASGSTDVGDNRVRLLARDLPTGRFGIFLASMTPGFTMNPGGSEGNLCLSGAIGNYNAPSQIFSSGSAGQFDLLLDLQATPTPTVPVAISAGQTWYFQAWYRDLNPTSTTNFTDGVEIGF